MLRLKSLELEGFRSFKQKTLIEFPESGLMLISGKWSGSDVSSGSGKSAVLLAIAFALDICDLPATELKNWDSKKMSVRLCLADDSGVTYEIIKDPKLSLIINGVDYDGTATGAKDKLQQILQTSPDLLKTLTYRQQRENGKFINFTDVQMKEFLSTLLHLNTLEDATDSIDKELQAAESEISLIQARLSGLTMAQNGYHVSDGEITQAREAYQQADLRLASLATGGETDSLHAELAQWHKQLNDSNQLVNKAQQAVYTNQTLLQQAQLLQQQISALSENKCYTCQREWHNQEKVVTQKQQELQHISDQMAANNIVIKSAEPIRANMPNILAKIGQIQQAIGQTQAPIADAQRAKASAESVLRVLASKVQSYQKNEVEIATQQAKIATITATASRLQHERNIIGRNGFLGHIFDEVLKEVEMHINDMLGQIPNVSAFAVELSSTTVAKTTGAVKKTVSKKIFKHGKEISFKSLSGGQQCALELCADLAARETIRTRAGSHLGWINLDEAMDGLGVVEKQCVLDMIRRKVKGLAVIVDHSTEIKEGFEKTIDIVYDGKESHVKAS